MFLYGNNISQSYYFTVKQINAAFWDWNLKKNILPTPNPWAVLCLLWYNYACHDAKVRLEGLTSVSTPSIKSMRKNRMDQNTDPGRRAKASG